MGGVGSTELSPLNGETETKAVQLANNRIEGEACSFLRFVLQHFIHCAFNKSFQESRGIQSFPRSVLQFSRKKRAA